MTTPLGLVARGVRPAIPGPLVVPILRAGLGLLDGVLAALPDAEVGGMGLKRDEATHRPLAYLERLPDDLSGRHAYIVDPMLATGGSLATACDMLRARGSGPITALCLIAAPEGVERVRATDPSVRIFTAAVGAPYLHLLPRPLGVGQPFLQIDAEVDLLARHALFLDAVLLAAVVPGRDVGEPHAGKIRLALGCARGRRLQVRSAARQARNPRSGIVQPLTPDDSRACGQHEEQHRRP